MAKMFYSLEEAAKRLGKDEAAIREMVSKGELSEYRDGDNLVFTVQQIDLLAGDGGTMGESASGMSSMIPLTDTGESTGIGMDALDDSVMGGGPTPLADSGPMGGGMDVFDSAAGVDPSADTLVSGGGDFDNVSLESFGSGSGLMDLTRESDDTSLGAEGLLDDLYAGDGSDTVTESVDLFEGAASAEDISGTPGAVMVAQESIDPNWSGATAGLSIGAGLAAMLGIGAVTMGIAGALPAAITGLMDGNMMIPTAALAGMTLVFGGIGFVVGGKAGA